MTNNVFFVLDNFLSFLGNLFTFPSSSKTFSSKTILAFIEVTSLGKNEASKRCSSRS
jgi:hypothetical protein